MSAVLEGLALKGLKDILSKTDWTNYFLAALGGAVDLYLLAKAHDIVYLAKNIGIPVLDVLGLKMPDGLKYESVGQIGMLIAALFVG